MANKEIIPNNRTSHESDRSIITPDMMAECCRHVIHFLNTEKRFLQPAYSLWELARDSGMTARLISKSINEYMGQNFHQLMNRLRVDEAKRLLQKTADPAQPAHALSLKEIGVMSGFRSRSVFFSRFKEYEGITPGKYMALYGETEK